MMCNRNCMWGTKATNRELQDKTMNMNTDVECTKATNLELKVMFMAMKVMNGNGYVLHKPLYSPRKTQIKPWL